MRSAVSILLAVLLTGGGGSAVCEAQQVLPTYTLETIVVTATRTPTPSNLIGSSVEVLSGEELRERGATTLMEALSHVPGLAMTRAGDAAGTASVYLRGAKSEHLLVLIDGVAVNDPVTPGGSFDWNTISTDAIERIEIVKGPQSTLYGSDAIAGVVNIITRSPSPEPAPFLNIEAGSYSTLNTTAGISGRIAGTGVRVELSRRQLGGISSAAEKFDNTESDDWSMWSGALRLERNLGAGLVTATLRGSRSRFDLDDFGGPFGDDPNSLAWKKDLTGTLTYELESVGGWRQRILAGASRTHRWGEDRSDPGHPDERVDMNYRGLVQSLEWHHTLTGARHVVAAGITLERQSGQSDYTSVSGGWTFSDSFPYSEQSAAALYLQDQVVLGPAALTAGGRLDSYSDYGLQPTFRAAAVLGLGDFRVRASLGTGFRAPSLYQRFSPDFGNADLYAETSLGWDAGVEVSLFGRGSVELTRYRQKVKDLIDFVTDPETWVSSYRNRSEVRTDGWEASARMALTGRIGVDAGLTLMEARDIFAGEDLVRRPGRTLTLGMRWRPAARFNTSARVRHVGRRKDINFSSPPYPVVYLEPVTLVDGEVTFRLNEGVALQLRLRNITDASPVWVWGYGSMGRAAYLGILLGK